MTPLYIPAPPAGSRIVASIIRDARTAKMIALQILYAISRKTWFAIAAVIAGAIVARMVT